MRSMQILARAGAPVFGLSLTFGLIGCGGVEPVAISMPANDPTVYATLQMNHHVVTLATTAPYDTVQLVAMPRDLAGNVIPDLPKPFYYVASKDTTALSVTADGLVRARGIAKTRALVIARLELPGNLANVDTTFIDINANASPPRLASISGEPADSAVIGQFVDGDPGADIPSADRQAILNYADDWGDPYDFLIAFVFPILGRYDGNFFGAPNGLIRAFDSLGNTVTGLQAEVRVLDPGTGLHGLPHSYTTGGSYSVSVPQVGSKRFEIRTTAYGITVADTVTWKVTPPPFAVVHFMPRFDGTTLDFHANQMRIRTHGLVFWLNWTTDTTEVVFDDTTNVDRPTDDICNWFVNNAGDSYSDGVHCGSGNVVMPARLAAGVPDPSPIFQAIWYEQVRQFPVAGTYRFHDPRTGKTGEIIVTDGP